VPPKTNKRERIAVYARVSTLDKGQTTKNQIRQLAEFVKRRKWPTATVFEEKKSGALAEAERPVLAAMMERVRRREFDVVLVWSFDRFARSLRQLVNALEEMKSLGVEFVSYQEQIDTTTPLGEALFAITGALAQLERRLIQERSKAGYERALEEGKLCHRPQKIFDHFKMLKLFAHGKDLGAIATAVGVSKATISRRLTDKFTEIREKTKVSKNEMYWAITDLPDSRLEATAAEYNLETDELRRLLLNGRRR
jgi:DNA invertase Pin-like site-specific DNA recombinase